MRRWILAFVTVVAVSLVSTATASAQGYSPYGCGVPYTSGYNLGYGCYGTGYNVYRPGYIGGLTAGYGGLNVGYGGLYSGYGGGWHD